MKLSLRGFLLLAISVMSTSYARQVSADETANCSKKGAVSVLTEGALNTILMTRKSIFRGPSSAQVPLNIRGFYAVCNAFANNGQDGMVFTLDQLGQQQPNGDEIADMEGVIEWLLEYNEDLTCGVPENTKLPIRITRYGNNIFQYYDGRTVVLKDGSSRTNPIGQHILKIAIEGKQVGLFAKFANLASRNPENKAKIRRLLGVTEMVDGKPESLLDFIDRLEEDKNYEPELLGRIRSAIRGAIR